MCDASLPYILLTLHAEVMQNDARSTERAYFLPLLH
jgi:hypothetical protein